MHIIMKQDIVHVELSEILSAILELVPEFNT